MQFGILPLNKDGTRVRMPTNTRYSQPLLGVRIESTLITPSFSSLSVRPHSPPLATVWWMERLINCAVKWTLQCLHTFTRRMRFLNLIRTQSGSNWKGREYLYYGYTLYHLSLVLNWLLGISPYVVRIGNSNLLVWDARWISRRYIASITPPICALIYQGYFCMTKKAVTNSIN